MPVREKLLSCLGFSLAVVLALGAGVVQASVFVFMVDTHSLPQARAEHACQSVEWLSAALDRGCQRLFSLLPAGTAT